MIFKNLKVFFSLAFQMLYKKIKKVNTIDKLSNNLVLEFLNSINDNYRNLSMDALDNNPVFLIDDRDVIKPLGKKFRT